MDCSVINLKCRPKRLKRFVDYADREDIDYSIIEAIDGKEKGLVDVDRLYQRKLKPGELGCYLSHYIALEKSTKGQLLVFEDDVKIYKNFWKKIEKLMNHVPDDWGVVLLSCSKVWRRKYCNFLEDCNEFVSRVGGCVYGTHAYIIKKGAVEEMVRVKFPIDKPYDIKLSSLNVPVYLVNEENYCGHGGFWSDTKC